jgi:hypothetical protein
MLGADVGGDIDVACENRAVGKATPIFSWFRQSFLSVVK